MAVVTMQKVAVLAPKSLQEKVLDSLQKQGVVHISDNVPATTTDHTEVNFRTAELEFAITTLTDFADKDLLALARRPASPDDIIKAASSCDVRGIVDELHQLEKIDTEENRVIDELQAKRAGLSLWESYPRMTTNADESARAVQCFGTLPEQNEAALRAALDERVPRCVLESFTATNGLVLLCATVWKKDKMTFEEISTTHGWTNATPPALETSAKEELMQLSLKIQTAQAGIETRKARRKTIAMHLPALMQTRTFLQWLAAKQNVREGAMISSATMMVTGWIPKKDAPTLQNELSAHVGTSVLVLRIKPDEGEEAPVLLRNALGITPFESVTTLYGLPLYAEMDPTAMLSPFFGLFFALCLTDAGYGITIATVFGVWLLLTKKSIQEARLPWLLFFSGILAFIVGIPFGGWFGLSAAAMPKALSFMTVATAEGVKWRGQIWDLNTQIGINFLQNLSLVLGISHLFFGMFLAGWHKWIHGSKAQAFWENFTSHILLIAALAFAFAPSEWKQVATYGLYASLALIIWGKGYGSAWYLRPIFGALGVMNMAIGLLSNGLSYLRILALGLVTGAMAMAVNQVAVEMGKLFPVWIGIPVMILIALGGHLVSIALNTLGSFIHAGRLQFIEFFGQFFEGGGRPFSPFSRSTSSS